MARLPDLVTFAQHHNLKLGTIADLIGHRRRTERLVKRVQDGVMQHDIGGEWRQQTVCEILVADRQHRIHSDGG